MSSSKTTRSSFQHDKKKEQKSYHKKKSSRKDANFEHKRNTHFSSKASHAFGPNQKNRTENLQTAEELVLYGEKAILTLLKMHPQKVQRFFYHKGFARHAEVEKFLALLAQKKKVFRCVENNELEKIAKSKHHQGLVAVIQKPKWNYVKEKQILSWRAGTPLVFLNGISNPHNLGAILRSAAFFGLSEIILEDSPVQALPSASVWKNASGAMEYLNIYLTKDLPDLLERFHKSHHVVAAVVEGNRLLSNVLKEDSRPLAVVIGNEENGVSPLVQKACESLISIHGTFHVESLNVSVAAAIFFEKMFLPTKITLKKPRK